jgi:hypothetical protein
LRCALHLHLNMRSYSHPHHHRCRITLQILMFHPPRPCLTSLPRDTLLHIPLHSAPPHTTQPSLSHGKRKATLIASRFTCPRTGMLAHTAPERLGRATFHKDYAICHLCVSNGGGKGMNDGLDADVYSVECLLRGKNVWERGLGTMGSCAGCAGD